MGRCLRYFYEKDNIFSKKWDWNCIFLPTVVLILPFVNLKENSEKKEFMFSCTINWKKSRGPTIISSRAEDLLDFPWLLPSSPFNKKLKKIFKMGVSKKIGYRHYSLSEEDLYRVLKSGWGFYCVKCNFLMLAW